MTSDRSNIYFGLFPVVAIVMAIGMVIAGVSTGRLKDIGITTGVAAVLIVVAYLLVRVRRLSINAEADLLVGEIGDALDRAAG